MDAVDDLDEVEKYERGRLIFVLYSPRIHTMDERSNGTSGKLIYLGACLIAAVRLAREEKWDNSPRVVGRIGESVHLAWRVWERVKREFPQMFGSSN